MSKLIIGYCRVSSNKQFEEGHALERYIESLTKYGIPESLIYFDVESGVSDTRNGFNAVMSLVESGQVATVVIPNFDRLTRSPLQWEQAREVFTRFNVQVRFLEDGELDLNSPDGLFTGRVKAALAAQVRDRIRHHSISGHRRHRERKEPYKPIFGYIMIDGKIRLNKDKYPHSKLSYSRVARTLVDLFIELQNYGKTLEAFKSKFYIHPASYFGNVHLKAPSSTTGLKTWITNAMLRGQIQYLSFERKSPLLIVDGEHEPLITKDEWEQIKTIIDNKNSGKRTYDTSVLVNPLSGIVKCRNCGGSMSQRTGYKRKDGEYSNRLLVCRNARNKNGRCKPEYSRGYGLTIDKAERLLQLEILSIAKKFINITQEITTVKPEILELQESIKLLESMGDKDLLEAIERKKTKLRLIIETNEIKSSQAKDKKELLKMMSHPNFWEGLSSYERNKVYQDLIEVVWCDKGAISVVGKF